MVERKRYHRYPPRETRILKERQREPSEPLTAYLASCWHPSGMLPLYFCFPAVSLRSTAG
jgi:hypothetical protein